MLICDGAPQNIFGLGPRKAIIRPWVLFWHFVCDFNVVVSSLLSSSQWCSMMFKNRLTKYH